MRLAVAISFIICGLEQWIAPGWNGLLFQRSTGVTAGEGHIVAAILFVGAALLLCRDEK